MERVVVLGGGFAGLWSAVGAARALDEFRIGRGDVRVALINRDAWHAIRVRNYEPDLRDVRVALDDVLEPIGVERVAGEAVDIDFANRQVAYSIEGRQRSLSYDRLIFALGSRLVRPDIPGLAQYAFDVDTYESAARLNAHIDALPEQAQGPGQYTALVVGAGLTGIEAATELFPKLRSVLACAGSAQTTSAQVILADRQPKIGSDMGDDACRVIAEALAALGIATRTGVSIAAIDRTGATLSTGEIIPAATVVWCGGMSAHPLTEVFPVERDRFDRLPVNEFMRVVGIEDAFAAGDAGCAPLDGDHFSVVLPACPPNGSFCRPQRGLRLDRPPDASAAHRLVRDMSRPWRLGCGVHRRLGSPRRRHRKKRKRNQANHQLRAHLSTTITKSAANPRRCCPGRPETPASVS
jgi:NADH:ubiquinone reductase (H+-translocating)